MPRKGENIYKRKDGRWEGRYIKGRNSEGKALYGYIYAASYREVKQKLALARAGISTNSKWTVAQAKNSVTFQFIAEEWLSSIHSQIKESSYIKYRNSLYSYIIPYFANSMWNDITVMKVHSFCTYLLTEGNCSGKGLSPKTVSDVLSLLRNIFHYAQIHGLYVPCTGKEITIKQSVPETTVLSLTEQEQLCQYLYANISPKNLGILLSLFTGLRIGEICALKWEDFSFEEKTFFVHQTMQRLQTGHAIVTKNDLKKVTSDTPKTSVIITTPKSKCSIRTIPIPENLLHIIEKNFPERHGFVLTGNENSYIEPRSMQNHFQQVQLACELRPVNFHTLRHTFATRCIEVGFDVKSLSEILGHASVTITMNRYVHPSMELKQQNMERLSELFTVI